MMLLFFTNITYSNMNVVFLTLIATLHVEVNFRKYKIFPKFKLITNHIQP